MTDKTLLATAARMLIVGVGEAAKRPGLVETPDRFANAWAQWTSGYSKKAEDVIKLFDDGGQGYTDQIVVAGIPFYSKCEHHLADIFGTVSIGYIPDGKITGLSKLPRLVEIHARRLQVQERMTLDIANDLNRVVEPRGVAVVVRARHMCMESRGICKDGHETTTQHFIGAMADLDEKRTFLATCSGANK